MAQRHEVEAWVNPTAWDSEMAAERVVDAIMEAGTDDKDVWEAIARREDGADLYSLAAERSVAQEALDQASRHLRGMAVLEVAAGEPEAVVARRARVSRTTLRKWLGK